jgi:two-component system, chemotaxis family, CheB/CheR fusion protein
MIQKTQYPENDLFIIAIGASAGGMEAIHLLFDHTPEDDVAYVIIQHLSPDHKSFMAELLSQHSKLEILVAESNMLVKANRVYLLPKGKNMTINDKRLYLTDIEPREPNRAVDIFFDSLAQDLGDRSIAIILSGTGADGTKGINSIKKSGGFVIVQDPESAKFQGMPNSAIESGNVDVIRPPELIPGEIIAHLSQGVLENSFNRQITQSDDVELLKILNQIQAHTPFDFSEYKRPTIIRRIAKRMTKNNISFLKDYGQFLDNNPEEINILAKEFLISVTKFFRDKHAFDVIKESSLREIIQKKLQVDTLKIWVVGCATGEEAYSMAILILEELTELKKNLEVKIFASDIDKTALQHASKGVYSEYIERDVSQERLDKYFIKQGKTYKIRENVRKMIIFAEHDIVKQPPYGKIDLISCRNLLIYINPILQRRILTSLHFCLNLGGYLFLGPSESLGELKKSFVEVDKKWKIYKSIEVVKNLRNTTYSTPGLERHMINPNPSVTPQKSMAKSNLTELTNNALLEETGYQAGIWVDIDFEIIQTSGDYEKFLLPKIFNFNLLEMLPEELAIATSTSLKKAFKSQQKVILEQVHFSKNNSVHFVNILVKPFLSGKESIQDVFLVMYLDNEEDQGRTIDIESFQLERHTAQFFEDMKLELADTKSRLKDAFEELEVSNDNISSYNEELISGNEEMQSTNEELQSVNEELQTVNNEYQLKIKELAELNDDLNNYFKSTINAQLYVDKDLILRKFTPSAILQINLKESDLGRLISDISTNIRFSTLMDDIAKVVSTSETIKKEVQTLDGKWYQMAGIPYIKQQDNQKDGAIITFNDITELKKVQDKLSRINQDHDTFIYSVSHDLKGPLGNLNSLITFFKESIAFKTKDDLDILDMIVTSVDNLTNIISELSDIVRIENEIDKHDNVDLKNLLKEIKKTMKDKIENSKANIQADFQVKEIPFSKKHMRSIFGNLLSNAIKYSSEAHTPEIYIKTEKVDGFDVLSIKDNGMGIPANKIDKIFAKFNRAHDHVEGSGVGLFLVKKIINNSGGDIEVESEVGKGSTFKVYFKRN